MRLGISRGKGGYGIGHGVGGKTLIDFFKDFHLGAVGCWMSVIAMGSILVLVILNGPSSNPLHKDYSDIYQLMGMVCGLGGSLMIIDKLLKWMRKFMDENREMVVCKTRIEEITDSIYNGGKKEKRLVRGVNYCEKLTIVSGVLLGCFVFSALLVKEVMILKWGLSVSGILLAGGWIVGLLLYSWLGKVREDINIDKRSLENIRVKSGKKDVEYKGLESAWDSMGGVDFEKVIGEIRDEITETVEKGNKLNKEVDDRLDNFMVLFNERLKLEYLKVLKGKDGGVLWIKVNEGVDPEGVKSLYDGFYKMMTEKGLLYIVTQGEGVKMLVESNLVDFDDEVLKKLGLIRYNFELEDKVMEEVANG